LLRCGTARRPLVARSLLLQRLGMVCFPPGPAPPSFAWAELTDASGHVGSSEVIATAIHHIGTLQRSQLSCGGQEDP